MLGNPSIVGSTEPGDLDTVAIADAEETDDDFGVAREDFDLVARAVVDSKLLVKLSSHQLRQLFAYGSVNRLTRRQLVPTDSYHLILVGCVSVQHPASDTITYLGAGRVLGPDAGFAARAYSDITVLKIPRRVIEKFCARSRPLTEGVAGLAERRARHLVLAAHEFFADMSPIERAAYVAQHAHVDFPAGANVTVEGQRVDNFSIVLDGSLAATTKAGRVGSLRNGDVFGHFELLSSRKASSTITAQSTARLAQLVRPVFLELIASQPRLLARLTAMTSHPLRHRAT